MILAVDDEQTYLELVTDVLVADGHEVKTFLSAFHALVFLDQAEPQLIISDVNMPEMDGFQFYLEYQARFSHRHTPFVFLSSRSDPETVVKGLNSGVDDYLQKPLHPEIIKAKVDSILQRRKKYISQKYTGDLEKMPFAKVLQFCELKHLTGWVDILSADYNATINFKGGELQLDDSAADLEKVFDLPEGHFTINVQQVDYHGLHPESSPVKNANTENEKPMGKLSGIKIQKRLFQIQTEFAEQQDGQIVSIVVLDGRVVLKRISEVPASMNKMELEKIIELQHLSVEEEVHVKLAGLLEKNTQSQTDGTKGFHQLYDAGFDEYCKGDFPEALKYWEEAEKINPADKTLTINLSVVRKKLSEKG